jgi:hypothetical protein
MRGTGRSAIGGGWPSLRRAALSKRAGCEIERANNTSLFLTRLGPARQAGPTHMEVTI